MGLGTFLLLFSLDGLCTFTCGTLTGILHLHTRTTPLHRFVFGFPLQSSTFYFSTLIFTFGVCWMNLFSRYWVLLLTVQGVP